MMAFPTFGLDFITALTLLLTRLVSQVVAVTIAYAIGISICDVGMEECFLWELLMNS